MAPSQRVTLPKPRPTLPHPTRTASRAPYQKLVNSHARIDSDFPAGELLQLLLTDNARAGLRDQLGKLFDSHGGAVLARRLRFPISLPTLPSNGKKSAG